jgi:hypothetical protein
MKAGQIFSHFMKGSWWVNPGRSIDGAIAGDLQADHEFATQLG